MQSIAGPFSVSGHPMEVRRHGEAIGGNLLMVSLPPPWKSAAMAEPLAAIFSRLFYKSGNGTLPG